MIYVINLDRSTDRLASFRAANAHLEFRRFPAIDGSKLEISLVHDVPANAPEDRLIEPGVEQQMPRPAIGNALSHLAIWRMALTSSEPTTILEDDAVVHRDFLGLAGRVIRVLPADWAMIVWGWNFDAPIQFQILPGVTPCRVFFDQNALRRSVSGFQTLPLSPVPYRHQGSFGTIGYSVSPGGARLLIDTIFPMRKETAVACPSMGRLQALEGLDVALHRVYAGGKAYVCLPPLVVTKNDRALSTIQRSG
ncbi:MAG TPA: glycosyltransferase family 25 protein [Stellaceae bacterium]|nr:glycosyltransferase family 25 protein [Stellaceae bacterium]